MNRYTPPKRPVNNNPPALPEPPQPAAQIAIPTRVPIQPVPTVIDLDILTGPDGRQNVGMRIQDPGGIKIVMLNPEAAKELGENLKNVGVRAATGLTVVGRA